VRDRALVVATVLVGLLMLVWLVGGFWLVGNGHMKPEALTASILGCAIAFALTSRR